VEFPRHLHKASGRFVVCPDDKHYTLLAARGWALMPPAHVEQPRQVRLQDALADPIVDDAADALPASDDPPPPRKKRGKTIAD
jgi:hypothetical protein